METTKPGGTRYAGYTKAEEAVIIAERQGRVAALTRAGYKACEIAAFLGTTERTVVRDRRAAGCALADPARPLTEDERRRADDLLNDGCSIAEVARTLDRSTATIHRHFQGRGWTRAQQYEHISVIRRFSRIKAGVA